MGSHPARAATFPVDLHMHSTMSDGQLTPTELVEAGAAQGLQIMSLTDHDTVAGFAEATSAAERCGIRLIPGVEISASFGREVHLLGYFFDPENVELVAVLQARCAERVERVREICNRLSILGCVIDPSAVLKSADGNVGRPHIARALLAAGHVRDMDHAFTKYLGDGRPAYVPASQLSIQDAIALIHRAGGITSIAHPGVDKITHRIGELQEMGLDAVEVEHPSHNPGMRAKLRSIVSVTGLGITGGSDLHLRDATPRFGTSGLDLDSLKRLESRVERRREASP